MFEKSPPAGELEVGRLGALLRARPVLRGRFTLASGRTSDYYIDCRKTTLGPEGGNVVGRCVLTLIDREGGGRRRSRGSGFSLFFRASDLL